jgi:hypothetical protein
MHSDVFSRRNTSPAEAQRSVAFLAIHAASLGALHASFGKTAPSSSTMAALTAASNSGKLGSGCLRVVVKARGGGMLSVRATTHGKWQT